MRKLFIYPTPLDALCQLQHDSGFSVDGIKDTDSNGRDGQSFLLSEDIPNGWGSRLVLSAPKKISITQRGILFFQDGIARFYADDFIMVDAPVPIVIPPVVPPVNPPTFPTDPFEIVKLVHRLGKHDLSTKAGCGQFTEDSCKALHDNLSPEWGHIRKRAPQNLYNGHAVDAVQLLTATANTAAGVYDLVKDSESANAEPSFNFKGSPEPALWYYPA